MTHTTLPSSRAGSRLSAHSGPLAAGRRAARRRPLHGGRGHPAGPRGRPADPRGRPGGRLGQMTR